MKIDIIIPERHYIPLIAHLFQNELEQGCFLFARTAVMGTYITAEVVDQHFVRPDGWDVQGELYLEMKDSERAKIMAFARGKDLSVIDCHSHPKSGKTVSFSPSDKSGITEFAGYARWKLDGKPFMAIVWGESSADAKAWHGDFARPSAVDRLTVSGTAASAVLQRGTWFVESEPIWHRRKHGRKSV